MDNTIEQEIYERNTDYKKSDKKIAHIIIIGLFLNAIAPADSFGHLARSIRTV